MATDKAITYDNPVVQGGVDNYLGKQPQVQAPRKWQSSPDKPATELAYITEAEKDLILKANIHGGLEGGPNMGPSGIMSLDSFGDVGGAGASGGDTNAGGGAMSGRGFSGQNTNTTSDRDFDKQKANQRAALQIAERAQSKKLSKLTGRRVKETANIANRTYGPLQKYTGQRGFLGNLFRGANKYGYTDTYTDGPNQGEVKPGYGGRILGGILGLLTGVPGVGSIIGNQIDKYKPKPKDMTEFNKLGLGGVNPATLDFDPNAQINQNVDTTGYSRFSDKSLGLQTPNYQTGSVSFDPSLGNRFNSGSVNFNPGLGNTSTITNQPSKGIMQTISDAFFSPAGAAELTVEEMLNNERKSKGLAEDPLTAGATLNAGAVPDLSNPNVLNNIAINTGMPMEGVFTKTPTTQTTRDIKSIQDYKRNPDLQFNVNDIMELDVGQRLGEPQIQSIFDMVQAPGQTPFLAADGGLASMFTRRR